MEYPLVRYWELLAHYLRPMRVRVALLALLVFSGIGLQLVNPQIVRFFIDTALAGQPGDSLQPLWWAGALFLIIAFLIQIVGVAATYVGEDVGWRSTNQLRADLVRHCLHLDMTFHNEQTPGAMIERVDSDVADIAIFFSQLVIRILGNALLIVGVLIALFLEDWRISFAFTVYVVVAAAGLIYMRQIAVPYWKESRQASADLFGFLEEQLAGTEDLRSSGATGYVIRNLFRLSRVRFLKELTGRTMSMLVAAAWMLFYTLGLALAIVTGYLLYRQNILSIGSVFLVVYYTEVIFRPMDQITREIQNLQKAAAGIERVENLKSIQSRIRDDGKGELPDGPLAVEFRNVTFSYRDSVQRESLRSDDVQHESPLDTDVQRKSVRFAGVQRESVRFAGVQRESLHFADEPPVLQDVSFTLEPGQVLGLLGRTGSGKTTLTRLLFRLYDARAGDILFSGQNGLETTDPDKLRIQDLRIEDLRTGIGLVTQEVQLFRASVRDNLTLFDPTVADAQILDVIQALELTDWLDRLSDGLDTELSSEGTNLSAGEAQLLAFTRVFLKDPGLVVLDEASSRLDPATERLIERAMDRLLHNRTGIIIAHRLDTVERADLILILESGKVAEFGPRTQLVADPHSRFSSLLRTGLQDVLA